MQNMMRATAEKMCNKSVYYVPQLSFCAAFLPALVKVAEPFVSAPDAAFDVDTVEDRRLPLGRDSEDSSGG